MMKTIQSSVVFINKNLLFKILVVDVYIDWAGACSDLMMPTYKMLTNTYDDWDKRIEFLEVSFFRFLPDIKRLIGKRLRIWVSSFVRFL